jgi:hypothetical protein
MLASSVSDSSHLFIQLLKELIDRHRNRQHRDTPVLGLAKR